MREFLKKRWFLTTLAVLIAGGLTLGSLLEEEQARAVSQSINPRWTTAFVLFLMALTLNSRHLTAAFRHPGPVVWASSVNYGLIPLMAWPLMAVQLTTDFQIGLMIAASVPCTLAAASVWTRKAGGNDAVSLMVTLVTNLSCFLVTPFWLNLTTAHEVALDGPYMIWRLLQAVLIPTLLGQLLRLSARAARWADRFKVPIGVVAQSFILLLIFTAATDAGRQLANTDGARLGVGAVVLVWGTCILLHVLAMAVGLAGARGLNFERADRAAVAFASSQKTLPIGILLATDPEMFGAAGVPFAVFPILMYHASQLFIDTAVADRLLLRSQKESSPAD